MNRFTVLLIGVLIGFLWEYFAYKQDEKTIYIAGCSDGVLETSNVYMFHIKPRFCNKLYENVNWRLK